MKKMNSLGWLFGLSVLLMGCGGGGDDLSTVDNTPQTPPTIQSTSANVVAGEGKTLTMAATGSGLSFTISKIPNHGSASISSSGVLTYIPNNNPSSASDSVSVTASNSLGSATAIVQFTLQSDPLSPYQWHLINTGQDAFSTTKPMLGNDLNVKGVWASGITGKGVIVNVVDSGLEIAHPDLAGNVSKGDSVNFGGGNDPTNTTSTTGDHGTSVAGLISSEAGNGIGGKGVAYGAKIMGHNYLGGIDETEYQTASNFAAAFGGSTGSAKAHIFNASFGGSACIFSSSTAENTAFSNVKNLRVVNGVAKGGLIVKSAGNGFGNSEFCANKLVPEISNGNAAFDQANVVDNVIVVAAVNANGKKSSYSTTGANIWVSGFGGETGANAATLARYKLTSTNLEPAMITTDQSGCQRGYEKVQVKGIDFPFSLNDFQDIGTATQTKSNPDCNYTSTFNGTSSAAPTVSGVIALMLEANPNLTWRDVKHILAKTAKQVDAGFTAPIYTSTSTDNSTVKANQMVEQGWVTNNAGYQFHNWYGFGLVDAGNAVAMAKVFPSLATEKTSQFAFTKNLPLNTPVELPITTQIVELETAQIAVDMTQSTLSIQEQIPLFACLQVELTSAKGTTSILLNGGSGFLGFIEGSEKMSFTTNAFYGEAPNGTWKTTVRNICTTGAFTIQNAKISITARGR